MWHVYAQIQRQQGMRKLQTLLPLTAEVSPARFWPVQTLVMRLEQHYGIHASSAITRNEGVEKMGFKQMLRIRDLQHENDQLREHIAEMEEMLRKNNMHLLSRHCWCKPEVTVDTSIKAHEPQSEQKVVGWQCSADGKYFAEFETKQCRFCRPIPEECASCQCGWKGSPDERRTQWGRKAYCPICGNHAPIRDFSA